EPPVRRRSRAPLWTVLALALLLVAVVAVQLVRPLPQHTLRLVAEARHTFAGQSVTLPWPRSGQAALGAGDLGSLGESGNQVPTPTASVAKVMTAYVFLKDQPLGAGLPGPSYTISTAEAGRLQWRKNRDESLVEVTAGESFTQRQALRALLQVSASNVAHEIARWDGGERAFVAKMNAAAQALGMTSTTYTDPSGYDAATVSTAADQVRLLTAAMRFPAFREVVAEKTFTDPTGQDVRPNSNALLGSDGVVGGKTGYTDRAGGTYVFASRQQGVLLYGAVLNQPPGQGAAPAIEAARQLIQGAARTISTVTVAGKGDVVARLDDGLGGLTPLVADRPVVVAGWPGMTVRLRLTGKVPAHPAAGERLGLIDTGAGRFGVTLPRDPGDPPLLARLIRVT
ncbi:MAG: D-alanyl-D-alanine carboxypeptidase, partial [Streptosporangiaceae bacterium]